MSKWLVILTPNCVRYQVQFLLLQTTFKWSCPNHYIRVHKIAQIKNDAITTPSLFCTNHCYSPNPVWTLSNHPCYISWDPSSLTRTPLRRPINLTNINVYILLKLMKCSQRNPHFILSIIYNLKLWSIEVFFSSFF